MEHVTRSDQAAIRTANYYRTICPADLDREADALLFLGRVAEAERLSHQAAELRQGDAA
jgi:hypothetical protein